MDFILIIFILFFDTIFAFVLPTNLNSYSKSNKTIVKSNLYIVGGTDAQSGETPYQVSLQTNSHICGAAIISTEWLITAAHCIDGVSATYLSIRYGTLYHSSGGQSVGLKEVVTHPLFNSMSYDNDIALIRTSSPMDLGSDMARAIELPEQDYDVIGGQMVTITGWGLTAEAGNISPNLQKITIPVVDRTVCQKAFKDYNEVTENMFCAGIVEGGVDSCQGDSGGPVVYNTKLVGIVSWGYQQTCARPQYYGVYTRIANYRNWIKIKTFI